MKKPRKRDQKKILEIRKINWTADELNMKCYVKVGFGKEEVRDISQVRKEAPQKLIDYFIKQAGKNKQ